MLGSRTMQAHEVPLYHARQRPLRRAEYDRMVELGLFERERVELIRGMLVEMAPIGPPHADPIDFLNRRFVRAIADERAVVRIQQPFAASDDSEPEPDLSIVPPGRYGDDHPDRAFLIVEVADSSLAYDRETKGPLYAESGVPEYWIVDVAAQRIEVYTLVDGRYGAPSYFARGQHLAPRAFSDVAVVIDELFP
jgi:Uma2 family endonuclease